MIPEKKDIVLIICLLLLVSLCVVRYIDFSSHPLEDAAMSLRYAQHIAQGHGFVWNIGEKPVDGSVDFLFVVLVAVLAKVGLSLESVAHITGITSHLLTVLLIYLAISSVHRSNRWLAFISAAYLACGPGLQYVEACFGTPLFTLLVCITWILAYKLVKDASTHSVSLFFSLSALAMGLARPEGALMALFMLVSIIMMKGFRKSLTIIAYFTVVFAVLGGLYFVWRWNYFGYPLPNPYYVKGGGVLYRGHLIMSIKYVIGLCGPFTLVFLYAACVSLARYIIPSRDNHYANNVLKQMIFPLIPIAGFTSIWILVANEMNYVARFQYPLLPVVLISWPLLLKGTLTYWHMPRYRDMDGFRRITVIFLIAVLALFILRKQYRAYGSIPIHREGRYNIAIMLKKYKDKNYTIATTEAGILPLYSNWRAVDTYGLNDQWIAHSGAITESYLDLHKPEIIMMHDLVILKGMPSAVGRTRSWLSMTATLEDYARKNRYVLAAVFGEKPYDIHRYYVRPDFPESTEIIKLIRNADYAWPAGRPTTNYLKPLRMHR
jgi:hypothetical protein